MVTKQQRMMGITLITSTGRVYQFFTEAAAAVWQAAYGGVVVTQQALEEQRILERAAELEVYAEFG